MLWELRGREKCKCKCKCKSSAGAGAKTAEKTCLLVKIQAAANDVVVVEEGWRRGADPAVRERGSEGGRELVCVRRRACFLRACSARELGE